MARQISLASRALLAIGLMIGFYVLAIAVAAGLLLLPYAEYVFANRVHPKLAIACIVGAGIILWSILPRRDRFPAPGPQLTSADHPRLFQQLKGVAAAAGQEMPAEVYLVADVNAWVAQRGGIIGFFSRRVMGLGLPLLQILSVPELQAVLAHEFGHYQGGDTKLGPWIYKTRAAIVRTLQNLAQHRSIVTYLFVWYGNLFMWVTQAISRHQEFLADQLAARVAGADQLAEGLKKVHGAGPMFDSYLNGEVGPVLSMGYRPPVAEGFSYFLLSQTGRGAFTQILAHELQEPEVSAYDSHPPLRERLAALGLEPGRDPGSRSPARPAPSQAEGLVPCDAPPVSPLPATSLLDDEQRAEIALLAHITEGRAGGLKPAGWLNICREVYVPCWQRQLDERRAAIEGIKAADLPRVLADWVTLAAKIPDPAGRLLTNEQRRAGVAHLLATALAMALYRAGWEPHWMPGESFFQKQEHEISPFAAVGQLLSGELSSADWELQCTTAGIADLPLVTAAASVASNS